MLNFIVTYLFIGVLFIIIVDSATRYADKRGVKLPEGSHWDDSMRLTAILIWPIGIIFFVRGFINEYFKKNK
tara:strand:+ start:183 stop:398 length:216 start_codon:yes stop_codon:yes gene_type:complete